MTACLTSTVAALSHEVRGLATQYELQSATAYGIGDQASAEELAQRSTDLLLVLPQLSKLEMLPDQPIVNTNWSARPTAEERGLLIVLGLAYAMLEKAHAWTSQADEGADRQNAVDQATAIESMVRRLHHLCCMAKL